MEVGYKLNDTMKQTSALTVLIASSNRGNDFPSLILPAHKMLKGRIISRNVCQHLNEMEEQSDFGHQTYRSLKMAFFQDAFSDVHY